MKVSGSSASEHDSMCWDSQPSSSPMPRLIPAKELLRSPLCNESGAIVIGNAGITASRMCYDLCIPGFWKVRALCVV